MALIRDITVGQYYPGQSFIHALDPRSKLSASLILMTCLLFANGIYSIALQCATGVLVWLLSGLPGQLIFNNLKPFLWLISVTALIHIFSTEGRTLLTVPLVEWIVTDKGIINAVVYSARLLLLVTFAAFLTMTTPPIELTDGLEKLMSPLKRLRVPVHEFALMVTLSLRFIPILIREAERLRNAQMSRGVSLEGPLLQRVRALVPMILPLFINAMRRAEDLAIAMESRAYTGGSGRTSYRELVLLQRDFVALGSVCLIAIATLVVN